MEMRYGKPILESVKCGQKVNIDGIASDISFQKASLNMSLPRGSMPIPHFYLETAQETQDIHYYHILLPDSQI